MRRFWTMVAHYHGNVWKHAELARALDISAPTVGNYLDALVDALVVRRLPPWYENLKKRQVKAPKVYLADSGLLHALLGLESPAALLGHPKSGLSWEGFALHEVVGRLGIAWENCYYWATHGGAELDLLAFHGGRRVGFEFKRTSAPGMTRSMHAALADLKLDRLFVIFPGDGRFPVHAEVEAVGLERLLGSAFDRRVTARFRALSSRLPTGTSAVLVESGGPARPPSGPLTRPAARRSLYSAPRRGTQNAGAHRTRTGGRPLAGRPDPGFGRVGLVGRPRRP